MNNHYCINDEAGSLLLPATSVWLVPSLQYKHHQLHTHLFLRFSSYHLLVSQNHQLSKTVLPNNGIFISFSAGLTTRKNYSKSKSYLCFDSVQFFKTMPFYYCSCFWYRNLRRPPFYEMAMKINKIYICTGNIGGSLSFSVFLDGKQ